MKGPSWLDTVPGFDFVRGTTVDYMHCVLLGVTRQLIRLWFETQHSKELWYIGNKVTEVDSRLLDLKPPSEMKRTPRSMENTRKFWKGETHACHKWFSKAKLCLKVCV